MKQEEVKVQYNAMLEMYGQKVVDQYNYFMPIKLITYNLWKVEEYEELKLDLVDLKSISQMYKKQIDELTQKLNEIENKPKNT